MKIVGCDLHAKQQSIAMVDPETGEFTEKTLSHEGNEVREFYAGLEGRVVVGIEATGAMQWFLELLEGLGEVCRVGHPAKIRAAETRKQKHDRRDARLILDLLTRKDGFPEIWMPSIEQRDLRTLLRDRHQWVKMRTRVQNTLQAIALNHALRRGRGQAKGKIKAEVALSLTLTSITVKEHTYAIQTSALDCTAKGKGKRTAATTGGGAAGGALIGGLAGGGKGAGIGALVGAGAGLVGGVVTGNKQIEIPAESALSFQLSAPLTLPPPSE